MLLIERAFAPYKGKWACPGGFVEEGEDLTGAAARELKEETGLSPAVLTQIGAWGRPGRDPRGRVISAVYTGIAGPENTPVEGADDARRAGWHPVGSLPPLAFDHDEIISAALKTLRSKCERSQMVLAFLPEQWTSEQLSSVLSGLGAPDPRRAADRLIAAAPDVNNSSAGHYHRMNECYLEKLNAPVAIFPNDLI